VPKLPRPHLPRYGEMLRNARLARDLTIEDLADASGLSPSALRGVEEGTRPAPPEDVATRLSNALQISGEDREMLSLAAMLESPIMGAFMRPHVEVDKAPKQPPLTASILVFLIADVRGYTRFTQAQGDAAAARLATRFADLARGALEQWEGRLVEVRGDEIFAVFASARQALHAALEMQTRFDEASREDPDLPLAVGIGLDVGEAVQVDDGYRGAAVNRAARLCALAGGGEILVTAGLMYIAPIVDGVAFVSHGKVPLKGFDEPADVLSITRATLTEGTPPAALPAPANEH
jgi:class 3 adenylate cyclase